MRAGKALVRPCVCADSSEPSGLAHVPKHVKVFRVIPEFRILGKKVILKILNSGDFISFSDLFQSVQDQLTI